MLVHFKFKIHTIFFLAKYPHFPNFRRPKIPKTNLNCHGTNVNIYLQLMLTCKINTACIITRRLRSPWLPTLMCPHVSFFRTHKNHTLEFFLNRHGRCSVRKLHRDRTSFNRVHTIFITRLFKKNMLTDADHVSWSIQCLKHTITENVNCAQKVQMLLSIKWSYRLSRSERYAVLSRKITVKIFADWKFL